MYKNTKKTNRISLLNRRYDKINLKSLGKDAFYAVRQLFAGNNSRDNKYKVFLARGLKPSMWKMFKFTLFSIYVD